MKLIILDRDGVINKESLNYIRSVNEWIPEQGSIDAIIRLSKAGYTIAIATNQSGVGRGYYSHETLAEIHAKMRDLVEKEGGLISAICYCPHTPQENCDCRKPKVGLISQIEEKLQCSAKNAWFVGDSARDIEAARAKNCKPVLVKTGNGLETLKEYDNHSFMIFENLAAFSDYLLCN